jgi:hypothetical protein
MEWVRQTQAVERVVSLLPASLVKGDDKGGAVAVMSVLTSTEEDRRRKDERQAQVTRFHFQLGFGGRENVSQACTVLFLSLCV